MDLLDLDTGERVPLGDGAYPVYLSSGQIIYHLPGGTTFSLVWLMGSKWAFQGQFLGPFFRLAAFRGAQFSALVVT